ncbi:MAG: hypothetical protein AAGA20_21100 [Planctomycetota bacterium]
MSLVTIAIAALLAQSQGADELRASLTFNDGSSYAGILDRESRTGLRIQTRGFDQPATIDLDVLASLVVESGSSSPASGRDGLTLLRRQAVRGRFVGLTEEAVVFESDRFGRLVVPRDACGDVMPPSLVQRASRAELKPLWEPWMGTVDGRDGLEVVDDALVLRTRGAVAARECLAGGTTVELRLAWQGEPEFRIHVGGDHRADPPTGVVLQPWDRVMVLYTFDGETLDSVTTGVDLESDSAATLRFFVDDEWVRLASVETADGSVLPVESRVRRSTGGGVVAIEALGRSMRVLGAKITAGGGPRLARTVLASEVGDFDAASRTFTVDGESVPFDESEGIRLSWGPSRRALTVAEPAVGYVRLTCRDGEAIECSLLGVTDGALRVRPRYAEDDVDVPVEELRELFRSPREPRRGAARGLLSVAHRPETAVRMSRLRVDGDAASVRIYGFEDDVDLETGVPFTMRREGGARLRFYNRAFPHVAVLRDGQLLPIRVVRASDDALDFESPFFEGERTVAKAAIEALLVDPVAAAGLLDRAPGSLDSDEDAEFRVAEQIDGARALVRVTSPTEEQRDRTERIERALRVPRDQAEDPGTHLFLAKNGDLLRADLAAISVQGLVTARGGAAPPMQFPIDRLASVVHVAPDPEDEPVGAVDGAEWSFRVGMADQVGKTALLRGQVHAARDGWLDLDHAVFGRLRLQLDAVAQLESRAPAAASPYAFTSWTTWPMPAPAIESEEGK